MFSSVASDEERRIGRALAKTASQQRVRSFETGSILLSR